MPGGTFKGTDEELQKLAEFITTLQPARIICQNKKSQETDSFFLPTYIKECLS